MPTPPASPPAPPSAPLSGLFDLIVIVDWSAQSSPKLGRDSIWICSLWTAGSAPGRSRRTVINHPTRAAAAEALERILIDASDARVLVGCDFSFGYPSGFARAAGLVRRAASDRDAPSSMPSWLTTWQHLAAQIDDRADNANNRFTVAALLNEAVSVGVGPFWGSTSPRHIAPNLSATKAPGFPHLYAESSNGPDAELAEFRRVEQLLRAGGRRPGSIWQLAGVGSVGSQTLTGIPVAHRLRSHPLLASRSLIWPFETGLDAAAIAERTDCIVWAEVWPSALPVDPTLHEIRDAAQVIGLAEHLTEVDHEGRLAAWFAPEVDEATRMSVVDEEGWILGVPGHSTSETGATDIAQVTWMM